LRRVDGEQGAEIVLDGRRALNFSSNNYLGLAAHPALKKAAQEAIERYGCGSAAVPPHFRQHRALRRAGGEKSRG
jgi:7-keto-8-aminopelargonate synthetase-like enzyme